MNRRPDCCWDERRDDGHAEWCENRIMTMTKAQFVRHMGASATGAVHAFVILATHPDPNDDDLDTVRAEAEEAAACLAGIGSCHSGGCKHG